MSRTERKMRKLKKREQANRRQTLAEASRRKRNLEQWRYRQLYPSFCFDAEEGDPEFVDIVRKVLRTIDFEDESVFSREQAALYRMFKQYGAAAVADTLLRLKLECRELGSNAGRLIESEFTLGLGQVVVNRIPSVARRIFLPFNDVAFVLQDRHIKVLFRSLMKAKGSYGTFYYSRNRPTVEIDGEAKVVAFSKHAVERTGDRLRPGWQNSYAALGDVFAYLDQCMYFEPCTLYGGHPALTFYEECHMGYPQWRYVEEVLGQDNFSSKAGVPCLRVGYCPAVVEGEFIKAKTLLFPGYKSTPEYDLILRAKVFGFAKQRLIDKTVNLSAETVYGLQDFSLIKWFHDHGVPQVVQLDRRILRSVG